MFRWMIFIAAFVFVSCERSPVDEPEARPTDAPLQMSSTRPDPVEGSPLQRLLTHGRCYRSSSHVLCANDHRLAHWQYPKIILVGQRGVLHLTDLERLETRGGERAMRFSDRERFTTARQSRPTLRESIPAPAYVQDEQARYLKCGERLTKFEPMPSAQSRSWLKNAEIRLPAPTVTVSAMKTADGVYVVEVTREGAGRDKFTSLHIGKPSALKKIAPKESNVVLDQGYREFLLPGGGRLFYPLNPREMSDGAPAARLPDGSRLFEGQALRREFEWSTYQPSRDDEPKKLVVLKPAEQKRLEAQFASEPRAVAISACSLVADD